MRKLILLIGLLPGMAMANEQPKGLQPKPKPPQVTGNPCALHGPGFVQVQGTTTCIKVNGSIRTDVTTSGSAR